MFPSIQNLTEQSISKSNNSSLIFANTFDSFTSYNNFEIEKEIKGIFTNKIESLNLI